MKNKAKLTLSVVVVVILIVVALLRCHKNSVIPEEPVTNDLPDFIYTVRAYGGANSFQYQSMRDMGLKYVQPEVATFAWDLIESSNNVWKWQGTDDQMDIIAQSGLKVIAFIGCPKSAGLPWDSTVTRDDPRFVAEYGEFAYEVVKRYHQHPAWSGLVAVWGGSSDIWDHNEPLTDPEVVVPLLNAAYDGIKRADPNTIVIGFNFATTAGLSATEWEEYHLRAFAKLPKFDWYGVQSHNYPVTQLENYSGVAGLINVRRFLDLHNCADKPLWVNEGGFWFGEVLGGLSEQAHAEQVVETFIVGRTLNINLKGWVYFNYFDKNHLGEDPDYGLMSTLKEHDPPEPRKAWLGMQTLIKRVGFFEYKFEARLSGEYNQMSPPFVYRFAHYVKPSSKLWIIFSPRLPNKEPINQNVTINITPSTQAIRIDMLGNQNIVGADSFGNVVITATSSPIYLKAGD